MYQQLIKFLVAELSDNVFDVMILMGRSSEFLKRAISGISNHNMFFVDMNARAIA